MTLKELRMWHWKKALSKRAGAEKHARTYSATDAEFHKYRAKFHRDRAKQGDKSANFHMHAVQLLNDLLPETTAEEDCSEATL